jgi:hypothetical protein
MKIFIEIFKSRLSKLKLTKYIIFLVRTLFLMLFCLICSFFALRCVFASTRCSLNEILTLISFLMQIFQTNRQDSYFFFMLSVCMCRWLFFHTTDIHLSSAMMFLLSCLTMIEEIVSAEMNAINIFSYELCFFRRYHAIILENLHNEHSI